MTHDANVGEMGGGERLAEEYGSVELTRIIVAVYERILHN